MAESNDQPTVELNMTPMIDVVFLLLIFFMLVSEIAKLDTAKLSLPYAPLASMETDPDLRQLTVSIQQSNRGTGNILIQGREYNKKEDLHALIHRDSTFVGRAADGSSELCVFVRADRDVPAGTFNKVLEACSDNGVYRVAVGATSSHNPDFDPVAFAPARH